MPKVGKYKYSKSDQKGKKLMTVVDGKTIHFGSTSHQQFKDKTGIWKSKDHGDPKRRQNFRSRTKGIKTKTGKLAYLDPSKAAYHAINVLW